MKKGVNSKDNQEEIVDLGRNSGDMVGNSASVVANLLTGHGNLSGTSTDNSPAVDSISASSDSLKGNDNLSDLGGFSGNTNNINPDNIGNVYNSDNNIGNLDNLINNLKAEDNINSGYPKTGNFKESSFINASQASFILGIISNWYLLVAIPAMTVTYNVFKSLKEQGILDSTYKQVYDVLQDMIRLSSECPQLIYDINKFVQCLGW